MSKEKTVEIPITIFHPFESRFKGQTTNIGRGSSSGEMTNVEGKFYLKLHNVSFLRNHNNSQTSNKSNFMPWLGSESLAPSTPSARTTNALLIHQEQKQKSPDSAKQKPFRPNKIVKLADIATSILEDDSEPKKMDEMVTRKF